MRTPSSFGSILAIGSLLHVWGSTGAARAAACALPSIREASSCSRRSIAIKAMLVPVSRSPPSDAVERQLHPREPARARVSATLSTRAYPTPTGCNHAPHRRPFIRYAPRHTRELERTRAVGTQPGRATRRRRRSARTERRRTTGRCAALLLSAERPHRRRRRRGAQAGARPRLVGRLQALANGAAMAMGDLVLTEDEVGPVMRALQEGGVEQTALHNHVLARNAARDVHAHHGARRRGEDRARRFTTRWRRAGRRSARRPRRPRRRPRISTPRRSPERSASPGKLNGGVYQVSVPRSETITEDGPRDAAVDGRRDGDQLPADRRRARPRSPATS